MNNPEASNRKGFNKFISSIKNGGNNGNKEKKFKKGNY
jgi:hypothetical protein